MPTFAVIFVPDVADASRWLDHCYVYCAAHHYTVLHVVRRWADVMRVMAGGTRAVVVMGSRRHLDPHIEVVTEQVAPDESRPSSRRTSRT